MFKPLTQERTIPELNIHWATFVPNDNTQLTMSDIEHNYSDKQVPPLVKILYCCSTATLGFCNIQVSLCSQRCSISHEKNSCRSSLSYDTLHIYDCVLSLWKLTTRLRSRCTLNWFSFLFFISGFEWTAGPYIGNMHYAICFRRLRANSQLK